MKAITVVLADDHPMIREGLRALLKEEEDIALLGMAKNGMEAIALAQKFHPEVIVMDISMPLLNGFDAMQQILLAAPATLVLMLSTHSEDAYVQRAMALGASGYVLKEAAQFLPQAIREIRQGKSFFSPGVSKRHPRAVVPGLAS